MAFEWWNATTRQWTHRFPGAGNGTRAGTAGGSLATVDIDYISDDDKLQYRLWTTYYNGENTVRGFNYAINSAVTTGGPPSNTDVRNRYRPWIGVAVCTAEDADPSFLLPNPGAVQYTGPFNGLDHGNSKYSRYISWLPADQAEWTAARDKFPNPAQEIWLRRSAPDVDPDTSMCFVLPGAKVTDLFTNVPAKALLANMVFQSKDSQIVVANLENLANRQSTIRGVNIGVGNLLASDMNDGYTRGFYAATVPSGLDCDDFELEGTGGTVPVINFVMRATTDPASEEVQVINFAKTETSRTLYAHWERSTRVDTLTVRQPAGGEYTIPEPTNPHAINFNKSAGFGVYLIFATSDVGNTEGAWVSTNDGGEETDTGTPPGFVFSFGVDQGRFLNNYRYTLLVENAATAEVNIDIDSAVDYDKTYEDIGGSGTFSEEFNRPGLFTGDVEGFTITITGTDPANTTKVVVDSEGIPNMETWFKSWSGGSRA